MKSLPVFVTYRNMINTGANKKTMKKKATDPSIESAARELLERYGETAQGIARERATALGVAGSSPQHDTALLVLSAVEKLSIKPSNGEPT